MAARPNAAFAFFVNICLCCKELSHFRDGDGAKGARTTYFGEYEPAFRFVIADLPKTFASIIIYPALDHPNYSRLQLLK